MSENTTQNTQQPSTPTPEETGGKSSERMFTQDEVNKIVSDRLARVKSEAAANDREQVLKTREARLDCREYIAEKKLPAVLLDVLDTSDKEAFVANAEKLAAFLQPAEQPDQGGGPRLSTGLPMGGLASIGDFSEAFKPKIK